MLRRTPRSTRTDTLFPYTTLFRSAERNDSEMTNLSNAASEPLDFSMPSERPEPGRRDRLLAWGAAVLVVIALAAVLVPARTIAAKKSQLQEQTHERLQITEAGQAGVCSTWLQGTRRRAETTMGPERLPHVTTEKDMHTAPIP